MKLERLHEYILPTVVTLLGMGFAAYCGNLSANGQTGTLATILALLFLLTAFLLFRANIWMLIPLTFALSGQMPILPLPFAVRDLVVFAVFACFLVFKAAKVVRLKPKLETMDMWMFAMLLYLLSVYIRNPVGVDAFQSERVGGRNYLNVFVACLAYGVLARTLLAPRHVLLLIGLICLGRMSEGILSFITFHFPQTVPILAPFYSTIERQTYVEEDIRLVSSGEGTSRQIFLALVGNPLTLALWSLFRPLTVINPIYIGRFVVFIFASACVFASGFRTSFVTNFALMYLSTYFRRGSADVLRLSLLIVPVLLLLIAGQGMLFDLPLAAQRALSFLPGRWDPVAVEEAQGSTKWRVDMWKIALSEEKYLHNKWLGDGFGFSQRDLVTMAANQATASPEALEENQLISGGVHSGPISAMRFVGGVGLIIYIVLMIVTARAAWRLIRRAQGSPYYPLALFLGLPLIWEPFYYIFIFGGYDAALPLMILAIGMLKMLTNSLDVYAAQVESLKESKPAARSGPVWQRPPLPASAHLFSR